LKDIARYIRAQMQQRFMASYSCGAHGAGPEQEKRMKALLIALMSGALLFGSYAAQARTSSYHGERGSSAHTEYSQHTRNSRYMGDRHHREYRRDTRSHHRYGHYRSARYGHHYGWHHGHSYHRSYHAAAPHHHYR
jgi:hypothetical protein